MSSSEKCRLLCLEPRVNLKDKVFIMFQLKYLKMRENDGKEVFLAKTAGTYLWDQTRRFLLVMSKHQRNLKELLSKNFAGSLTSNLTNGIGTLVAWFLTVIGQ